MLLYNNLYHNILLYQLLFNHAPHILILRLHALEKSILRMCSHKVVISIANLVVCVAINIIHQEAKHLLVGDI